MSNQTTEINKQALQLKMQLEQAVQELSNAKEEIKSLKADLIAIQNQNENQRITSIRGKGMMHTNDDGGISRAEYERMLPAKLAVHSLEEVCKMIAASAGVNSNPASDEFGEFFGMTEQQLEKARIERMRSRQK